MGNPPRCSQQSAFPGHVGEHYGPMTALRLALHPRPYTCVAVKFVVLDGGKGRNIANDRKPVGLLFAGSSSITVACPIDVVLNRFGVSVDGE